MLRFIVIHSVVTCYVDPSDHIALALAWLLGHPVLHLSSETQRQGRVQEKLNFTRKKF